MTPIEVAIADFEPGITQVPEASPVALESARTDREHVGKANPGAVLTSAEYR